MASMSILCLSFIFLLPLLSNFSSVTSLTFSLSNFYTNPSQDSYQNLISLVSSSLTRAIHLKNPRTTTTTKTNLSSHSYGGYSISLSFGTPPQTIPFILDTGSDLVWLPCTSHYLCKNCSSLKIPSFIPKRSSSSKILGCQNPKCSWIHHKNIQCQDCNSNKISSRNCTQICPSYFILYGSGETGGIALSETLNLPNPNKKIPNFLIGCSVISYRQPAGIAGFGRGKTSLPSQLNLNKFSYCLLSHKFDDTTRTSSLILENGSDSGKKTTGLIYTPFVKNPRVVERNAFLIYYYVGLRRISVGGRHVRVPHKYLIPDGDGNGGSIVDSGTTFTFMAPEVFEPLADEFLGQMQKMNSSRALGVEISTGLRPCFEVPAGEKKRMVFPEIKLHFKGGAEMALPVENYIAVVGEGSTVCLTVVTDKAADGGPAIILGNFMMQNYYVEYDLKNERLGFKQQLCS